MSGFVWFATTVCGFLLTYLVHSTVIIAVIAVLIRNVKQLQLPKLRLLGWKAALYLPLLTTIAITLFQVPNLGVQIALDSSPKSPILEQRMTPAFVSAQLPTASSNVERFVGRESFADFAHSPAFDASESPQATENHSSRTALQTAWVLIASTWAVTVLLGFARLLVQARKVRQLRQKLPAVSAPVFHERLARLVRKTGICRPVELLESDHVSGAFTAGIARPFIVVPTDEEGITRTRGSRSAAAGDDREDSLLRLDALLAHELAHIVHRDALWNLLIQMTLRLLPCQPLNRIVSRRIHIAMDFAADEYAMKILGDQTWLVQCLIRMGDQMDRRTPDLTRSGLVAGMLTFRSVLGQRVAKLLEENGPAVEVAPIAKLKVLTWLTLCAILVAAVMPQAVAEKTNQRNENQSPSAQVNVMRSHLSALAVLFGLTAPAMADDPPVASRPAPVQNVSGLKTTPDKLPEGIRQFNGMLVGRLAAKDVEKGSFTVAVDAVPRVWRGSKAENPKAIVGKTVEVNGVFGRFLDVLVTTRTGETLEFECKHDGDGLIFPGELLRKVPAYDAADYPVLPEAFRGFRGAVIAEVKKKDPETFELILEVQKVTDVWKENGAKQPESIVGKQLMLAGFWNRKEAYHNLKVGDRIEVGMQHIGRQSDHLTVAEFVRQADQASTMRATGGGSKPEGMTSGVRGFRGMLVGRLVKKDVERGTFTVTVDAVPRVWQNNQSSAPKSLIGKNVDAEGVQGKMLDALVVSRIGETIEFGALHDGGDSLRVGEVLRKVEPVKPGDYPVLPDEFRGFSGIVEGKVVKKNEHLWELTIEITGIEKTFEKDRSRDASSIVGKEVMLGGFWNRKDAYHNISVGDRIQVGVEHPQKLSDHLSVIEAVRKLEK